MSAGPDVFLKYWQDEQDRWHGRIDHPIYHEDIIVADNNIELMDKAKEICTNELGHSRYVLIMNRERH